MQHSESPVNSGTPRDNVTVTGGTQVPDITFGVPVPSSDDEEEVNTLAPEKTSDRKRKGECVPTKLMFKIIRCVLFYSLECILRP